MEATLDPATKRLGWIDRLPSWAFLAAFAGLIAFFWLLTLVNRELFWDNFLDKYIWSPIVEDEGYNVVNTVVLMVVLALILGWAYRLMAELGETVDLELTVAVVPYLVWGSIYRVLEDADLFGPFNEEIVRAGGSAGASCWPEVGGGFLRECFGVFFITPIIYVLVTFVAVFFLWVGHQARRVSRRAGPEAGLRFFALCLVGLFALDLAFWAAEPGFIRFVANPLVDLAALSVAFWIVWRDTRRRGEVNPRWVLFAFSTVFLISGLYYMLVWMTGGVPNVWAPASSDRISWWVLAALILGPLLVVWSTRRKGRILSGGFPDTNPRLRQVATPRRHVAFLVALIIFDAIAVFISMLGVHGIEDGLSEGTLFSDARGLVGLVVMLLAGPAALVATTWLAARATGGPFGIHPALVFFASPVNLLMVFGQASDGMMTSLGIDVFHYTEKHVLPGQLISLVDSWNLPLPFGDYPATIVMIPLKVLIVLLVVWLIDASQGDDTLQRRNLVGLVKLAIIMVGLSPGVRDAVRLAMGV